MLSIHHIVFPTDFSERCAATAPFVRAMATRFGARVSLISAIPPLWEAAVTDPGAAVLVNMQEFKADREARLARTLAEEFSGISVERVAEIGDPAAVITEFAHTNGADLIMMPTHGYGTFRSLLLGSVTAKVLHDAHCPVWTNAHAQEPDAVSHLPEMVVLCAVDGTPKTVPLMEWAARYCQDAGAALRIVHAVSAGVQSWPERQMDREFEEEVRAEVKESIERQMRAAGVNAPLCLAAGEVSSAVREEARRHKADLVIIGRGLLHETLGRLRTHSYGIIRHAPCPVLSV